MTSRGDLRDWISVAALVVAIVALAAAAVALLRPWEPAASMYPDPSRYPVPTPDAAAQARDEERARSVDPLLEERHARAAEPGMFVGAQIGHSENQVSSDQPLLFDTVHYDVGGFHDASQPTRLTVPVDGFYRVSSLVTVLGAGYEGSALAPEVLLVIVRNGDPTDIVAGDSNTDEQPLGAQLVDASGTGWFTVGDFVEVLVSPGMTVESNWPGRGTVSPILSIELLGR